MASTTYTPEIAAFICERVANGESVRQIAGDPDMPAMSSIFKWLTIHADFAEQYTRARETQMEMMAQEILDIADDAYRDTLITEHGPKPDAEWINRSRLRVDTRKWLMSKLAPKKYGDRPLPGADPDNPLHIKVDREEVIAKLVGREDTE